MLRCEEAYYLISSSGFIPELHLTRGSLSETLSLIPSLRGDFFYPCISAKYKGLDHFDVNHLLYTNDPPYRKGLPICRNPLHPQAPISLQPPAALCLPYAQF